MAAKQTYGKGIVWKPDLEGNTTKQIATAGREIFALGLKAGGASAAVAFYDAKSAGDANYTNQVWFLDASTTDSDSQVFPNPLFFKEGIYAVLEQGTGGNPVICIEYFPDQV